MHSQPDNLQTELDEVRKELPGCFPFEGPMSAEREIRLRREILEYKRQMREAAELARTEPDHVVG